MIDCYHSKCIEAGEQGKVIIVVNPEFVYGLSFSGEERFVERFLPAVAGFILSQASQVFGV